MINRLYQLLKEMTPQEQSEVEIFAAFVIARRNMQKKLVLDDISSQELMQLVENSGSFDWLANEEEDVYSVEDGNEVQWMKA